MEACPSNADKFCRCLSRKKYSRRCARCAAFDQEKEKERYTAAVRRHVIDLQGSCKALAYLYSPYSQQHISDCCLEKLMPPRNLGESSDQIGCIVVFYWYTSMPVMRVPYRSSAAAIPLQHECNYFKHTLGVWGNLVESVHKT